MSESTTPPSPTEEASGAVPTSEAGASQNAVAVAGTEPARQTRARAADLSILSRSQRQLLDELRSGADLRLLLRTGSTVDTGNWMRAGQVYLAVTPDSLILFADGKRPTGSTTPFSELGQSLYNHVTGKLVLAPAPEAMVKAVAMNPEQARLILHLTGAKDSPDV